MHRTQILLEDEQYARLKAESERSGRSLGDLVRTAVDEVYGDDRAALRAALEAASGAWSDLEVDGKTYVEQIRRGWNERLADLGLE
jgi:phage-related minor tail protein